MSHSTVARTIHNYGFRTLAAFDVADKSTQIKVLKINYKGALKDYEAKQRYRNNYEEIQDELGKEASKFVFIPLNNYYSTTDMLVGTATAADIRERCAVRREAARLARAARRLARAAPTPELVGLPIVDPTSPPAAAAAAAPPAATIPPPAAPTRILARLPSEDRARSPAAPPAAVAPPAALAVERHSAAPIRILARLPSEDRARSPAAPPAAVAPPAALAVERHSAAPRRPSPPTLASQQPAPLPALSMTVPSLSAAPRNTFKNQATKSDAPAPSNGNKENGKTH
jgi:hypothetical protein